MIAGVGVDAVDISRLGGIIERWGDRFLRRVFSERELAISGGRVEFFAGRFAAKEAYMKAAGLGIGSISFKSIEVLRGKGGRPFILVGGSQPPLKTHVSITHEGGLAISVVVIEDG